MWSCRRWALAPQPDCTAMYWRPATAKDVGTPMTPELVRMRQSSSPDIASKARK